MLNQPFMKNLNLLPVMLAIAALIVAYGCKKDDDEKSLGTLTVGTNKANLTNGFILNYGNCADFYLCTSGLNYEVEDGSGHFVNFTVYPKTSETFAGTYTYSLREDTTGTFELCEYYFNMKLVGGYISDFEQYGYATNGTITISQAGDIFTITIACPGYDFINQTAINIMASYTGALKLYIEEKKKAGDDLKFPISKE
jgi:hypothetical protein